MPPKKTSSAPGPSKKTEQKKKEKVIEDKTFGLKNKKGTKQQKFIQQVQKQVQAGGHHPRQDVDKRKEEKEKKLAEARELAAIFKPVQTQKVEKGTDPKSVVCAFFKQGLCTKGDKCKFSHDLTVENKVEKRSIYVDMRDDGDDMKNWDDAKLKEVVDQKHSNEKKRPTTDIICKFFIDAVEKSKYGWFWECPNGEKCIYRHALPQGYVLKKDKKKLDDKTTEISLEDLIEKERAALGASQTRVTLESFLAWKKRKIAEKKEKLAADEERKKNDYSKGKQFGISGREMFSFNPDLVDDGPMEEGDAAFDMYKRDEDDDDDAMEFKELDLAALSLAAQEVDGTGTIASTSRLKDQAEEAAKTAAAEDAAAAAAAAADESEESNSSESGSSKTATTTTPANDAAPINTELFMGLVDELDDLDSEDDDDE